MATSVRDSSTEQVTDSTAESPDELPRQGTGFSKDEERHVQKIMLSSRKPSESQIQLSRASGRRQEGGK